MPIIKNLHLLTDIVRPGDLDKMEYAALEHKRHSNITFKIVNIADKKITFRVEQGKTATGIYHLPKRLIEIVHETYDHFFKGWTMYIGPVSFQVPAPSQVDHAWILNKMKDTKTRLKDIADETGIDYTYLSTVVNGATLTDPMKAMFWYYFLSKSLKEAA